MDKIHARGKVLLTGEYMILDGAVGIGLPTHHGQILSHQEIQSDTPHIRREAHEQGVVRFEGVYNKHSHTRTHTSNEGVSDRLSKLFAFGDHQGDIHQDNKSYSIITDLSYPRLWGLGSSSTLIYLYARLIQADPFVVHQYQHAHGSGYDVACAGAVGPILFEKTSDESFKKAVIDRQPEYSNHLYFVYSGAKQDSNESIQSYRTSGKPSAEKLEQITELSHHIIAAQESSEFASLIREHENIIADHLQTQPIQISRFGDSPDGFQSKSLGGRGGDFLLIVRPGERSDLTDYLTIKDIDTIFSRDEFIL